MLKTKKVFIIFTKENFIVRMSVIINPFPQNILFDKINTNKSIYDFCIKTSKKYKSVSLSNAGGYQSPYFNYKTVDKNKFLKKLFLQITKNCSVFHKENKLWHEICLDGFWININKKTNFNKPHNHQSAMIAGVYYVNAPQDSGNLVLYNCLHGYVDQYLIKPENGLLVLFPAHFQHYVEPSNTNQERVSIAFNYIQKYE